MPIAEGQGVNSSRPIAQKKINAKCKQVKTNSSKSASRLRSQPQEEKLSVG